jgi:myo-inositol-1(or 4)-monophosphatase
MASERSNDLASSDLLGLGVDAWLAAFRRMVAAQRELFAASPGIVERTVYEGVGEGGDHSLAIDRRSEDIVFAELDVLAADGLEFTAISEERGDVTMGNGESPLRIVIDPIDGSLNARRTLPSHALSIAVAGGDSLADVELGYVYDFGASEEFVAVRGAGARLGDRELRAEGPGYGLEVVGIESAKPERVVPVAQALSGQAFRIRAVGSIAISLCYVAAGRFDGMLTGRACRSVDLAAAQLIVREAGAVVELPGFGLSGAPLSLDARYHVAAALDADLLAPLLEAQRRADELEAAS